ncbi:MAG: hypothetical protein E7643_03420 [Ruminococcaceae bacterium]|nr:hypothetical protein [Oscillospiraceae bacterium]
MHQAIPYPFYPDRMPLDISFVFADERPAGKHGFLRAEGRYFVFEDGTRARFWGTNFNSGGCFPTHAVAESLASRLSSVGINLVRFHQIDAEWSTPNLFAFSKGKRIVDASPDPVSLERLDYLIYCLKEAGIYCYMDMFTYRKFRSDEGVPDVLSLADAAKPYCIFSRRLIELQKELATRLWTHVNPYTGLAYCDDPVFVMAEITNECHLFTRGQPILLEVYRKEFLSLFEKWRDARGISKETLSTDEIDPNDLQNDLLNDFKTELQAEYFEEMRAHLRKIGVRIPITGTNMGHTPCNMKSQAGMDYTDDHAYLFHGKWMEFEKSCAHVTISQCEEPYLAHCALSSYSDKPLFISEWDMPWPNDFRAESPIYNAAIGCLQEWSGFACHTYSYTAKLEDARMLGKEVSCAKIGDTPYRVGLYSTWNDPAKFGLFYHAALMTRRGDVAPAREELTVCPISKHEYNWKGAYLHFEEHRVNTDLSFSRFDERPEEEMEKILRSDTGELFRDREQGFGYIDSPRTKCVYGFLGGKELPALSGMRVECRTDFAVIAISSLTDEEISHSDNLLLSAVGRARNNGFSMEGDRLVDMGEAPVMIEPIRATVEIETDVSDLVVKAVGAEGFFIGSVPTERENGKLRFTIGDESRSMYYLIFKA